MAGRIADLMLDLGRARAAGPLASGQAWGQGIARLGDLVQQSRQQGIQEREQAAQNAARTLSMDATRQQMAQGAAQETRAQTAFDTNEADSATQHAMVLHDYSMRTLGAVLDAPEAQKPALWTATRAGLISRGVGKPDEIPATYPGDEAVKGELSALLSVKDRMELQGQSEDRALRRDQLKATDANTAADNARADVTAKETARHNLAMEKRPVAGSLSTAADDVKESVTGMREGTIPPMVPGRASKEYLATLAEAHRQGYDLQAAVTDWTATQKHIATLNGQQQLRLNQSISALPELLDSVDALASKWKGGRFPPLNKANLALAKNGAYGQDIASIALQLDSQIADVTADLGNVYMGGNSPTDHALELAGKSLSGEWSEKVLHDMVGLARSNVTIRQNSIKNAGVQGASSNNPYAPPVTPAAPITKPIPGIPGAEATSTDGGKTWMRSK